MTPLAHFTPHEALICAMVLMASADGPITDPELARMSALVRELPAFAGFSLDDIDRVTEACLTLLGEIDGLERGITMIAAALPMRLRETAYLLSCEVAAADGDATQAELRFLQELRIGLDLDRLIAGAIERAARARLQLV